MLAIIRCLEQWDAELRSCVEFTILTDHKNLQYFMTRQKLSERQARWAEYLSRFNFKLVYRSGKEATIPDALSRRDQDRSDASKISKDRTTQLIPDSALGEWFCHTFLHNTFTTTPSVGRVFEDQELHNLWVKTLEEDQVYHKVFEAVSRDLRSLPAELQLKVQISECSIDFLGRLLFRGRIWIPGAKPAAINNPLDSLRTKLIQKTHDSAIVGHPGREGTISILSRDYYWPMMHQQVRQFLRNCDICDRTKVWREHKKGFLKPLPVPDRYFIDIAMDFITKLPPSPTPLGGGNATNILVITDRLLKNVTLEALPAIDAETVAEHFMHCYYRFHGFPRSITSDQGSQWVGRFWKHLYGSTERWNQEIWAYLRAYVGYMQTDWVKWLFSAQVALNNRPNSITGLSPFFITHGYHPSPIEIIQTDHPPNSEERRAEVYLSRLQVIQEFSQSAMAAAQQQQEFHTNAKRSASELYRMDWLRGKYTVSKVLGSHNVELAGLPKNISNVFHVDQLRRASDDPVPAQELHDEQPPPITTLDGDEEHHVEEILCARTIKEGEVIGEWYLSDGKVLPTQYGSH
ncbi:hypothetical protein K3495_g13398 [Podosphaera aphanis]|nr:hypothetical protein K3495_g13398 [Podosphaera aphanis]